VHLDEVAADTDDLVGIYPVIAFDRGGARLNVIDGLLVVLSVLLILGGIGLTRWRRRDITCNGLGSRGRLGGGR